MSDPYKLFHTDVDLETKGVVIDYGDFWFRVARAGGTNEKFNTRLRALFAPYRRAIETETMDPKLSDKLTTQAFLDSVLLEWGSTKHGPGKMVGREGEAIPFSKENANALFEDLPDLLNDLMRQSAKVSIFRTEIVERDSGNSSGS